jgi:hypothetical protein
MGETKIIIAHSKARVGKWYGETWWKTYPWSQAMCVQGYVF